MYAGTLMRGCIVSNPCLPHVVLWVAGEELDADVVLRASAVGRCSLLLLLNLWSLCCVSLLTPCGCLSSL